MGLGGVAIAILPSTICLKLTFSDGLGGNKDLGYFSRCLYLWICTKLYRILPKEMLYWWWRRNARKRHELMND